MVTSSEARDKGSPGNLRLIAIILVSGFVGGVLGHGLAAGPESKVADETSSGAGSVPKKTFGDSGSATPQAHDCEDLAIRAELEKERKLRLSLSQQVQDLRSALAKANALQHESEVALVASRGTTPPPDSRDLQPELEDEDEQAGEELAPWFNREALLEACGSASTVAKIENRWEQFEMDKLYLADEAQREGFIKKPKYKKRLGKLRRELRDEYTPGAYDAFLFALARPNRVVVDHVILNSPAGDAGLQRGDIVISYDGERVFELQEFKQETAYGEPGDLVLLDVIRDDEEVVLQVPRGPLGIRMKPRSDPPLTCY